MKIYVVFTEKFCDYEPYPLLMYLHREDAENAASEYNKAEPSGSLWRAFVEEWDVLA